MERLKQSWVRIVFGVLLVLVFLGNAIHFYSIPFIQQIEAIIYDARLRLTMSRSVDERIVILDIDEKSLAAEGHWPWPRNRMASLVDKLFDRYGIAVLGFDVVWAEKDESSGLKVLDQLAARELKGDGAYQAVLAQIRPKLDYDELFARSIKGRRVVLGYFFSGALGDQEATTTGMLPKPALVAGTFQGRNIPFIAATGYSANLPVLQQSAAGGGHFTQLPDIDGVTRRVPMLMEYKGAYYETLSLAMMRAMLDFPEVVPGYPDDVWSKSYPGLEWIEVGGMKIPVDENARALIPYRGRAGSFKYVSITDVLHDRVPAASLKDKIVILGTTAPGLLDLRSTPVSPVYPGVEVHANLISGMLDGDIKQKPPYVMGAEFTLLLVSGLLVALLVPLLSPLRATLVTLAVLGAAVAINVVVWHYGNLVLPLASGLMLISLIYAMDMAYGFFVEARAKRQITGLFGQYVPPELVDEMSKNPENFSMAGESREMSVLFSDVRGFTSISEGLDPKELTQLMNEFLTPLTKVIYKHRGTIDKYMGDCIMAFWGAPLDDAQHARHAILAGLEMQKTLHELQPYFKQRGWPAIEVGIGVNTGRMSVGNMGSEIRLAYTVMGDAVNLASRLEGITKQYGVGMVVGEATREKVPDFVFRELDRVRVKGKEAPVAIYEPLGPAGEVAQSVLDEIKLFQQALKYYRARDWDRAELQLLNLQKTVPEGSEFHLYQLYLKRIARYRAEPPAGDWDGVTTFETK
ncbi:MAG: adenylate/guanylate cyclase domain-containing protein [Pseudomonadota bacterium]